MYDFLIVRNGEIAIKGKNRPIFEKALVKEIRNKLLEYKNIKIKREQGRIHIYLNGENEIKIAKKLEDVFGIVSMSPAIVTDKGYDKLLEGVYKLVEKIIEEKGHLSFKIKVNRHDKTFKMKSTQMNSDIGEILLNKYPQNLKVDVRKPDVEIVCEFRKDYNIIYYKKIMGLGGMPRGINGNATVLLSGGIDSPVAAYLMAKKGLYIEAVHFHSFPFTNERSKEKVKELLKVLKEYIGSTKIYMVNLLEIQKQIQNSCPSEHMTIISRRFMMRIAEKIALNTQSDLIVTGESLGQVASQTAEGLRCTNDAVKKLPVLRPLIAMEKKGIIEIAKKIKTYDISIIPEVDSCTVFLPPKTSTRPKVDKIIEYEKKLDIDKLVKNAVENMEIVDI